MKITPLSTTLKSIQGSKSLVSGFSLVEVTLAIGITAVALVSLMGMLPKGLKTLQKAADQAVMGRINQQILGELQVTPWDSVGSGGSPLESFDGAVRIYDDQGIELPKTERGSFDHVYTAKISVPSKGNRLPKHAGGGGYSGVLVPGESNSGAGNGDYSRLAIVEITSNTDPNFLKSFDFDSLDYPMAVSVFRAVLVKMGQLEE
ncbi:MAG: Verru_Chthon cassette protein B [Verrucomicrobiae bacterium]|nr:Verru_Chthon cassette protein B [Verrucomicrobiae bacterium]